jgi:hypothetical protein
MRLTELVRQGLDERNNVQILDLVVNYLAVDPIDNWRPFYALA